MENQRHVSGETAIRIKGDVAAEHILYWPTVTDQVRRTWSDLQEATETGAEGIANLIARRELGYVTIERAALGTRIDRWLGHESDIPYFQRKARLEVSGILHDRGGEVERRMREKLDRLKLADSQLPAYVIVVEFSRPLVRFNEYEHD